MNGRRSFDVECEFRLQRNFINRALASLHSSPGTDTTPALLTVPTCRSSSDVEPKINYAVTPRPHSYWSRRLDRDIHRHPRAQGDPWVSGPTDRDLGSLRIFHVEGRAATGFAWFNRRRGWRIRVSSVNAADEPGKRREAASSSYNEFLQYADEPSRGLTGKHSPAEAPAVSPRLCRGALCLNSAHLAVPEAPADTREPVITMLKRLAGRSRASGRNRPETASAELPSRGPCRAVPR